ncbi:MAG: hypothetical protein LAQ69_06450 [Acidobacteriia bacterium]|nr:hypothetical protein [Terriglobia bacterium]
MTNRAYAYTCTLAVAFGLTALSAGPPKLPPSAPLENTRQLQSTLSVDRDTYFSGEAAIFTLTVRNPASTPLEVPTLFSTANGCFVLTKRLEGGSPAPLSAKPICPFRLVETAAQATTRLASGEERQTTLSADALLSALGARAMSTGQFLNRPGYYQIEYVDTDPRPSAVFRVVAPHLDAAAVVKLQDVSYVDPATRRIVHMPAYRHVFALRWNNQSFICVSQAPDSRGRAVSADGRGDYAGADFPYVRVAVSPDSVTSIKATADAQDGLTVTWQDATSHWHLKLLGSAPPEPVPGAVQVGLDSTFERLNAAEARQFTATVIGSRNPNLRWSVSLGPGAPVGAQPGSVSASGMYAAPVTIARPYRVILTARSQADESRSAVAVVSLLTPAPVTASAEGGGSVDSPVPGILASPLSASAANPGAALR